MSDLPTCDACGHQGPPDCHRLPTRAYCTGTFRDAKGTPVGNTPITLGEVAHWLSGHAAMLRLSSAAGYAFRAEVTDAGGHVFGYGTADDLEGAIRAALDDYRPRA